MNKNQQYRFSCTLTFGDIYGQIIVWLIVIFLSLATAIALMGADRPAFAFATIGLIMVVSLPFLLFTFVTTLINHIEMVEVAPAEVRSQQTNASLGMGGQRPAEANA
jgi:hypothetical protein